jgi:monovalent cation:H+ antiporter-2, CPA2 family
VARPSLSACRRLRARATNLAPYPPPVVRTHNSEEAALLEQEHVARAFVGEDELAQGMATHVLALARAPG